MEFAGFLMVLVITHHFLPGHTPLYSVTGIAPFITVMQWVLQGASVFIWLLSFSDFDAFLYLQWA